MRKEFYIFRHGQTDYNREKIRQGCRVDVDLNDEGVEQACKLAERLGRKGIEIIFSSDLKRAKQTAEKVSEKCEVDVVIKKELREVDYGKTEGLQKDEIIALDSELYQRWRSFEEDDYDVRFEGGESKREVAQRMKKALEEIAAENYEVFGVSTHGAAIRYLMFGLGIELKKIENGAVFHLVYEDGKWELQSE